jgi:chemotaxis protein methyltransferase CheR
MRDMTTTESDLRYVRELVQREAAIVLDASKNYLVEARLTPVARAAGLETIASVIEQLRRGSAEMRIKVIEALTTNETSFFRDLHPFEALATNVLTTLARTRARERRLRVWSAAASTGQEAYSIAMTIRDRVPELTGWDVKIVGTDITGTVLEQAREGRYSQIEVNRGLPVKNLTQHFERQGLSWRIKPELRAMCEFSHLNLVQPWPRLGRFDVVLIRNVLIYFDVATKRRLLDRIKTVLAPDGYLFLGTSETLSGLHDGFRAERDGRALWYRPL